MNRIEADEAVVFADAVHPTHAVRPVGCLGPKDVPVAVEQSSGRDRLNDWWRNRSRDRPDRDQGYAVTVDALSTIMLLTIEARYPGMRFVHVFLDNARYHHAKLVQAWLARPGCRVKLHFIPAYCPHLELNRTAVGVDASAYHPQQMLRHVQGIQHCHADLPARGGCAQELATTTATRLPMISVS